MYNLHYLPIAKNDMTEIAYYVSKVLSNPNAAKRLTNELIKSGERLAKFPYSNPVYMPIRPLKHEYRKMIVSHYIIFYWVNEQEKLVTIARVIYAKRDYTSFLNKYYFVKGRFSEIKRTKSGVGVR